MKSPEDSEVEQRLVLAIVLSLAILLGAPYLLHYFYPPPPEPVPATESERLADAGGVSEEEERGVSADVEMETPAMESVTAGADDTVAAPGVWIVENPDLLLRLSNRGGVLESARLTGYLNDSREPLELIPQDVPRGFNRVLDLRTGQEALDEELAEAVFAVEGATGNRIRAPARIEFVYRKGAFAARKVVTVPASGYSLELEASASLDGRPLPVTVGLGAGLGRRPGQNNDDFADVRVAFHLADAVERWSEGDLTEGVVRMESSPSWLALDSKYFAIALIGRGEIRGVRMERFEWTQEAPDGKSVVVPVVSGGGEIRRDAGVKLFIGPKDPEVLEAVDPALPALIDYGWFAILVKPLLAGLKWVHGYVGNYGWAIIVLTFLINLALFPVRYKQIVSMEKMSALQPKLRSIQDKYKRMKREDPRRQQMNSEVMALYKEHGVNPLGGCLPLLIQMPILFAFYNMLYTSIELRGAPFIWWIQDLSRHDPYFITPIVMGATMVAQQKMTPATGDPTQRRMMMFLPIMFTFFFLWVSSGLAVYFLFSNVFAMMFQLALTKLRGRSASPAAAPRKSGKK